MRPHRMLLWFVLLPSLLATSATTVRAQWQIDGGPVCTAENNQVNPRVVSDGAGGTIITWQDLRDGNAPDIYAQHVLASGEVDPAWPADGRALCAVAGSQQTNPEIVSDGAGGAIVTWQDARGNVGFDIYAQHVLASGAVDPAWPANGRALCTAANDQFYPQLVGDGAGGAIVTWNDVRADSPNYDIYAQHVLASGAVDPVWPVDGRALCLAENDQGGPRIASDGAGGAIVTWYDGRGSNYHIYAQHVLVTGTVDELWPVDGVAVCTAPLIQLDPAIVTDGSGGAIITWKDSRAATGFDIYAQRVLASGTVDPLWPVDGQALCTAGSPQGVPQIVTDGSGGAIVAWHDQRGFDLDIYAQHVLASGGVDPAWPADGTGVCTAASHQSYVQIVADGNGGMIATWQDVRSGTSVDVYAQHALASGVLDPAWPTDGKALCQAGNQQDTPYIIGDGAGGAIVSWSDARVGNFDIYASRVYASGGVADVPAPRAAAGLRLLAPYPSPSQGEPVTIDFDLPSRAHASAEVFDAAGRRVRSLMPDGEVSAGRQILRWDGRNEQLRRVPAGIYLVLIRAGGEVAARRMVVLE